MGEQQKTELLKQQIAKEEKEKKIEEEKLKEKREKEDMLRKIELEKEKKNKEANEQNKETNDVDNLAFTKEDQARIERQNQHHKQLLSKRKENHDNELKEEESKRLTQHLIQQQQLERERQEQEALERKRQQHQKRWAMEQMEHQQALISEKQQAVERETARLAAFEKALQEEKKERKRMEQQRERARKKAEELRLQQEAEEDKARKEREVQRLKARDELKKCRESTFFKPGELHKIEDKENLPLAHEDNSDTAIDKVDGRMDESRRKAIYSHVKKQTEVDSAYVKEAESAIAASHKARLEAERLKARIETASPASSIDPLGRVSRRPVSMYDTASPVYYARDSSARRNSKDVMTTRREIDDDLADEIEAIRLAADLSSRRLLADQKRSDSASGGGSCRSRIRAVLDKQRTQREEEERSRQEKRADALDMKYLWVYR